MLKETLTKLTLEIGTDGVVLLPFALYRVRNYPYQKGLTLFEIMFGTSSPITPNLQANLLADLAGHEILNAVLGIQWATRRSHLS